MSTPPTSAYIYDESEVAIALAEDGDTASEAHTIAIARQLRAQRDEARDQVVAAAPPADTRAQLYITFGVQYGTPASQARYGTEQHPMLATATGQGYLTVDYSTFGSDARERARQVALAWLDGRFAFDYDEAPDPMWVPAGEIARIVLP